MRIILKHSFKLPLEIRAAGYLKLSSTCLRCRPVGRSFQPCRKESRFFLVTRVNYKRLQYQLHTLCLIPGAKLQDRPASSYLAFFIIDIRERWLKKNIWDVLRGACLRLAIRKTQRPSKVQLLIVRRSLISYWCLEFSGE